MKLTEKKIEDLIYRHPWLIDSNFIVPKIRGASGVNGRQVNVGMSKNRYIDLLLKDTRDNRPVIIELKKGKLKRENIAQILEYKALIVSLPETDSQRWRNEFDNNYFAPKLILVGTEADEEVKFSANLAGVQIRKLTGLEKLEADFKTINQIDKKLNEWKQFTKTGNRTLVERNEWIINIIDKINYCLDKEDNADISTIKEIPSVSPKRAYFPQELPFINIPIWYKEKDFLGLYEYFGEGTPYTDQFIYCDLAFLIELKLTEEEEELVEKESLKILHKNRISIIAIENDWPVIRLSRNILESDDLLCKEINKLIKVGKEILKKIEPHTKKSKQR